MTALSSTRFCQAIRQAFTLLTLFFSATTVTAQTESTVGTQRLFQLINQRLAHMSDVAAYKWQQELAIENLAREKIVIENASDSAADLGLDAASTIDFFTLQIDAAKMIQAGWHNEWRKNGFDRTADIPHLNKEIRPKLIKLGEQIIHHIAYTLPALRQADAYPALLENITQTIDQPYINADAKKQLLDALVRISPAPGALPTQLDAIRAVGVIRVGTTGDYPPFSHRSNGQFEGIDIDLAHALADSLGVQVTFVQTSWPSLLEDLSHHKFDIAMSGISRKLFRQQLGFFSAPYHRGGKTPIVRCADQARFDSLEAIDEPGVRVVVNPGGTNERFTRANIKRATITVFDDNTGIFDQITGNHADVMFTDNIEVRWQTRLKPSLCAAMPGVNLTVSEKGFLMHRDIVLKEYVNAWLHEMTISGKLTSVFERHLERR